MKISKRTVNSIFSRMIKDGWDVSLPLKWGYYFYSDAKDDLDLVFDELKGHNYQLEYIRQNEELKWVLHTSKLEVLVAGKLHHRNVAFNELADAYDCYYDGWDVGQK